MTVTDNSTRPAQDADARLQPGWSGPSVVLDAADPDSWGPGIAAASTAGTC